MDLETCDTGPGQTCNAAASMEAAKTSETPVHGQTCSATLRCGKPCTYRSKAQHPELGCLCGVHLRSAGKHAECSICLADVNARVAKQLECGHCFHRRCIKRWFGRGSLTCPLCRAICFSELGSSHPLVSARIRHLVRIVPPPAGVCFAAYILGMLNSPPVLEALDLTGEQQQLLVELAYQSFTQEIFFEYLRQLNM